MASSARIDELKKKFDENPRRYFAPLANEFRKGGDLEQAILICEEFLPHQPGHMSGHIVYGQALFESGRFDDARTVFETALSLDPENLIALRHLGDIAGQQGDATGARRWYERVLEADPRNDEIQSLIAGLDSAGTSSSRSFETEPEIGSAAPSYGQGAALEAPPAEQMPQHDDIGEVMPIDLDETMPHGVPVVTPQHAAPVQTASPVDDIGLGDIVPMPDTAQLMPPVSERAEGFEATEFAAPEAHVEQAPGLQSAYEDETGIFGAAIAPLEGLDRQQVGESVNATLPSSNAFPELDGDDGLVLPPHGDPIVATAQAPDLPAGDLPLLEDGFEIPGASSAAEPSAPPAATSASEDAESIELMEFDVPGSAESLDAAPAGSALPVELPPEVIAAEAELVERGMSIESADDEELPAELEQIEERESSGSELTFLDTTEPSTEHAPHEVELDDPESEPTRAPAPFVTETMAELYLSQGFHQQALSVYEQLSAASPNDGRLAEKVAELRASTSAASAPAVGGPTVREFFARLAAHRPGSAAAGAVPPSDDDFATPEPVASASPAEQLDEPLTMQSTTAAPEPAAEAAPVQETPAPQPAAAPSSAPASSAAQPGGTIDALFGNKAGTGTDDSAASALAQAFGNSPDAPVITGRPARAASGELSLDSVFRDGPARPPRASQSFSFDQFFSESAAAEPGVASTAGEPAGAEPAERSADDVKQFNSWLQGLKPR